MVPLMEPDPVVRIMSAFCSTRSSSRLFMPSPNIDGCPYQIGGENDILVDTKHERASTGCSLPITSPNSFATSKRAMTSTVTVRGRPSTSDRIILGTKPERPIMSFGDITALLDRASSLSGATHVTDIPQRANAILTRVAIVPMTQTGSPRPLVRASVCAQPVSRSRMVTLLISYPLESLSSAGAIYARHRTATRRRSIYFCSFGAIYPCKSKFFRIQF